jgi:hypothetical protein
LVVGIVLRKKKGRKEREREREREASWVTKKEMKLGLAKEN